MELQGFGSYDVLDIIDRKRIQILEYQISRTPDKRLILDIKFDVSDAMLDLNTGVNGEKSVQE